MHVRHQYGVGGKKRERAGKEKTQTIISSEYIVSEQEMEKIRGVDKGGASVRWSAEERMRRQRRSAGSCLGASNV